MSLNIFHLFLLELVFGLGSSVASVTLRLVALLIHACVIVIHRLWVRLVKLRVLLASSLTLASISSLTCMNISTLSVVVNARVVALAQVYLAALELLVGIA